MELQKDCLECQLESEKPFGGECEKIYKDSSKYFWLMSSIADFKFPVGSSKSKSDIDNLPNCFCNLEVDVISGSIPTCKVALTPILGNSQTCTALSDFASACPCSILNSKIICGRIF